MLKNKKILITQPIIRSINGSTIVSLELALALKNQGAEVTIYTCDYHNPAKAFFEKNHFKVDVASSNPQYKLQDFDYIWVHSQIIPISILNQLAQKLPAKLPAFIFLHMSGMDWIPDEKPWIYDLENRLSSLSLFICEEVKSVNTPLLSKSVPKAFFRNPAPTEYQTRTKKPGNALKNLLIVSSHPPKEVLEAKKILATKHNINVTVLGEDQETYELFTKKMLEKYDAILTIAKTVQYCLVSGTPVYVYDAYGGGPGWINEKNFENAKIRNFSGYQNDTYPNYEGGVFHRKTAQTIVNEILNGYADSLSYHQKHQQEFYREFLIDNVLPSLFGQINPRKIETFSKEYLIYVTACQLFAVDKFILGGSLYDRDAIIHKYNDDIKALIAKNDQLAIKNRELTVKNQELTNFKKQADAVFQSKPYKVFDKIITPYKKIKNSPTNP